MEMLIMLCSASISTNCLSNSSQSFATGEKEHLDGIKQNFLQLGQILKMLQQSPACGVM